MIAVPRRTAVLALVLAISFGSLAPAAALAAAAPSSALSNAVGGGLGALPPSSAPTPTQTATTPAVVTTSSSSGGSFSSTDALLVAVGAIAVIAGIAYFIWSDSRHHVRLLHRAGAAAAGATDGGPGRGSKAPHKSRKLTPAERRRRKRGRAR